MMNEEVNAIIRQIVDYEVAEQMAAKSAEMEAQMAKKDTEHEKEIARLKAALQEALSQLPQ